MPQRISPGSEIPRAFIDLLREFDSAMLVTQRGNELRSRPMLIVDCTDEGSLWFVTSVDSGKLEEMTEHPQVNVSLQDTSRFASISGTVRVTRDRKKIDEVWKPEYGVWFEEGRDDPELVLVEVVPLYAEYWDRSGAEGVKVALAEIKSRITGEKLDDDQGMHEKLRFASDADSED
jgi:general stress protein 26